MNQSENSTESSSEFDRCILCKMYVDKNDPSSWKQVKGLVGGPKKDSMRLREDTGKFAHDECVKKVSYGQAADQPSIFESDSLTVQTWTPKEPIEDLFEVDSTTETEADRINADTVNKLANRRPRDDGVDIPF
jgi:hypothetical protein